MFRTFYQNLSKRQRIGLFVIVQVIMILLLVAMVKVFTAEKAHVSIENGDTYVDMPKDAESFISDNIWQVIKNNVLNSDRNDIDVVIRDGTYKETEHDDWIEASFIVDIDELKQSYTVNTGWSKDKSVVYEVVVDCPPVELMKYKETVCVGTFNDSGSLNLYLPYSVYPDDYTEGEDEAMAPEIYIDGDEAEKNIDIMVSICDAENFKNKAMDYLKTLPINLNEYTINYDINDINVRC